MTRRDREEGAEAEAFAGADAGAVGAGAGCQCRVCGAPLRIVQRHRGLCDDPACRRRDVAFQEKRRREGVTAEVRAIASRSRPDTALLPVVTVPGRAPDLVPLPESRRAAFARHLDAVLEQVRAEWTPLLPPRAETDAPTNGLADEDAGLPVLAAACGFCGGQCCNSGGDTALIEVATIQRILSPDQEEPDFPALRRAYLERLPAMTYSNSCVFHAEHGCALPREMRSRVCNRFACTGLAALAGASKRPPHRCLLATDSRPTPRVGLVEGPTFHPITTPP